MSHWYTQEGEACHFTNERDTTLRDARKLGLVPGFSGVTSVLAKPGLNKWFEGQLLDACLEVGTMRFYQNQVVYDEQDVHKWKRDVKSLAAECSNKARDRGLDVHDAIEEYIKRGLHPDFSFELEPYIVGVQSAVEEAFSLNIRDLEAETTFACPLGYGGMIDALWRSGSPDWTEGVLFDWKTKDKEFNEKTKLAYDEHGMQLAAYRYGCGLENAVCANIYISPSAKIRIHIWEEEELQRLFEKFKTCLKLWQQDRKYDSSYG